MDVLLVCLGDIGGARQLVLRDCAKVAARKRPLAGDGDLDQVAAIVLLQDTSFNVGEADCLASASMSDLVPPDIQR